MWNLNYILTDLGSVVSCLSLTVECSWPLLFQIFILLHSLFSFWYSNYRCYVIWKFPSVSGCCVLCVCDFLFPVHFFFCISVWEVSISHSSSSPILSSKMSNVLISFLNFYYNILDFYHFLLGFSQNLNHSAYITHLFSMLSTFPIRALRLLWIVI